LIYILETIAGLIGIMVIWGLHKLERKLGFDVQEKEEEKLRRIVVEGALAVEEWSLRKLNIDGVKVPPIAKASALKDYVLRRDPKAAVEKIGDVADAVLPSLGLGLLGKKLAASPSKPDSGE